MPAIGTGLSVVFQNRFGGAVWPRPPSGGGWVEGAIKLDSTFWDDTEFWNDGNAFSSGFSTGFGF